MHRVLLFGGLLLGAAFLAAPFLAGAIIGRRRHRAGFAAVDNWHTGGYPTVALPVEREVALANRFEAVVATAHETCARNIDAALRRFEDAGRAHYGARYQLDVSGAPQESVGGALARLMGGVKEPVAARIHAAHRELVAAGQEFDTGALIRAMKAEPVAA